MRRPNIRIAVALVAVLGSVSARHSALAQHGDVSVDWKVELRKAEAKIAENPRSAFWHNQAGVAYYALGDFKSAMTELELASKLEPDNPINEYMLYAMYKRRGMLARQKAALLRAIERDPGNPFGHYELAALLEKEKAWPESLKEYRLAKALVSEIRNGGEYTDPKGNPFSVDHIRSGADNAVERVTRLKAAAPGRSK
jgi:tetratricopeptide (TPR) repeat protein